MRYKMLVLLGFALVIILILIYLISKKAPSPTKPVSNLPTPTVASNLLKESFTIKVTNEGFQPNSVHIKQGESVRWVNETQKDVSVNSDDHPSHKKFQFLNLGIFGKDSSVQAVFDEIGEYSYHNHLNPSQKGKVYVVKEHYQTPKK